MATKTISLEIDAYEKLKRAKRSGRESFSSVVRRARWDEPPATATGLLESLCRFRQAHPERVLSDEALDEMNRRAASRAWRCGPTETAP